jgi:hypothetical protein
MRFLLVGLLLAQTVFPPGAPSVRPFPPGSGAAGAPPVCPVVYEDIEILAGQCDANLFVDCSGSTYPTVQNIAMFCWGNGGGANLGGYFFNSGAATVTWTHKNQAGEFIDTIYPVAPNQDASCRSEFTAASTQYCPS